MSDNQPALATEIADPVFVTSTGLICLPKPSAERSALTAQQSVWVEDVTVAEGIVAPVEIFASGMNGALHRVPKVRVAPVPLLGEQLTLMAPWRPTWGRVRAFGVT